MAGFMSGFGTTLANSIEQDREYYREAASKRRDYLQTYGTRAVVDREDKANAAMGTLNTLRTAGVDDNTLRYVLDKGGIQGVAQLSATIASRKDLTKDDIAGLVKGAKDYVSDNPDETFDTVINRAYGLYQSTDKPVERERNIFSSMLGLDSRMAEDEVLDDLYVNGYSGRDVYRIMGSSGPKAGESLSFNLPAKPPSDQKLAAAFKSMDSKFNTSIDAKISAANRANNYALVKTLEGLKGQGVDGIYKYATNPEYGDPTLLEHAKRIEAETPGAITRNSIYLGGFPSQFNSVVGDAIDDATVGSAGTGVKGTAVKDTVVKNTGGNVTKFKNTAEFNAAAAAGEIERFALVQIEGSKVTKYDPEANAKLSDDAETVLKGVGINPATATGSKPVTPEAIQSSQDLATAVENMSEVEAAAFKEVFKEVDEALVLSDLDIPGVADTAAGKTVGASVWVLGSLRTASAKLANFFTDNTALTTERVLKGKELQKQGVGLMADGFLEALKNRNNEQSADLIAAAEAITPEDIARIKAKLIKSEALKAAVKEAEETALSGGTREAYGDYFSLTGNKTSDAPDPAVNAQRAVAQQPVRLPGETPQEFMIRTGNKFESTPAIKADNGPTAEQGLMSKRLDDTNRRISEEDAAMGVDYPQPLDTVTIKGPTSEERLMDMPVKPSNELMSVVKRLAGANDEEKREILSKYIGEDGLPIFGPNYAAERLADTNRRISEEDAAMAVPLPQPLKEILIKVEAELGSELAGALAVGYQQVTMGSTELNSPSILAALSEVEEAIGPEASEVLIESFIPATMSATELNTPAIKAAIAKMPAKDRASGQDVINAYLTSGVKFKNEAEANAWIDNKFKGFNISKNIVKSLSKVLANDSNK